MEFPGAQSAALCCRASGTNRAKADENSSRSHRAIKSAKCQRFENIIDRLGGNSRKERKDAKLEEKPINGRRECKR